MNIVFRSVPKSLMAMLDCVPLSMASMRCEMGWPISILTPDNVFNLFLTSSINSDLLRSCSSNGASISDVLTPKACSSSSALPVFRATFLISGTESRSFSASRPIRSLSSRDSPGSVLTLMVSEPSLNEGRKLRPRVKKSAMAIIRQPPVHPKIQRLC